MHHPQIGSDAATAEFLARVGELADPVHRPDAVAALARLLGGEGVLLFAPDPELSVVLPAPGLPQVLPGAHQWQELLERCAREGECEGTVTGTDGGPVGVRACALPDGTAAVLLGPGPNAAGPVVLRPLLPLIGALFEAERRIAAQQVRARSAADAMKRSGMLTRSLQQMRQRLEDALAEARAARMEARERAEQAEVLAVELQAQAGQLQEQAVELEMMNDELAAHSEDAERARNAADEANRAKSEFLAHMSHELRTPINAVIGYADLLNMGITGPVTAEQQTQLERIRASSAHLLSLVNDVLDLSKVEAGRMKVAQEREPVAEVVADAVALIEGQVDARRLVLETDLRDARATYVGDRDRVRQILVNLLSNAVKFTEPGGRITIEVGTTEGAEAPAAPVGGGRWRYIAVEDTGIGMTAEEITDIFQPFVQADSGHTRTRGGTGLGLTISRQFARLMGGDLTVHSEKGTGSRFTLWLPATAPEPRESDASVDNATSGAVAPCPAGLANAGAVLRAELPSITAAFARRVQRELATPGPPMDEDEILDHTPTFVADVARVLLWVDRFGGDPSLLRRGTDVQRLIAEEHGADRGRRGWGPETLQREFDILREELVTALQAAAAASPGMDVDGVIRVVDQLIRATHRTSLRSLRAVLVAAGPTEAR